jgi:ATP-binding cassette subfamily C protein
LKSIHPFLKLLERASPAKIILLFALMLAGSITEGFGILLLVPMLDILQGNSGQGIPLLQGFISWLQGSGLPVSIGSLLVVFLLLVGIRSIVQYARERLTASIEHELVDQLRLRCFGALLDSEWRWIATGRKSDHANLLLKDVSRVGEGFHYGISLLAISVTTLVYLVTAFILSWNFTLLALISGAFVMLMLSGQRRKASQLGENLSEANRAMQGTVSESLAGIKLAKILGNESLHLDYFKTVTDRLRQQELQFIHNISLSRSLIGFGGAAMLAAYLYMGLRILETPVPELLTLVLVFSRLIPMFTAMQQYHHYWLHALPAVADTEALLAECNAHAEQGRSDDRSLWPVEKAICLEHVSVRFEERDHAALDGISLCIPSQTTTAIMGTSGAGKSTLADVLTGLLAPDEGVLTIDRKPVSETNRLHWRHSVAYVPQEVFLFNDSIRNNLLWARKEADEQILRDALQLAAADFVFNLPLGLDSIVGDEGVRLSGGERQRIALARALLKKPSLLILDEATSALDVENEARIRRAIENLHGDLTVVIIGHRLPTLEHADQVVILERGRVKAHGTWKEIRAGTDSLS